MRRLHKSGRPTASSGALLSMVLLIGATGIASAAHPRAVDPDAKPTPTLTPTAAPEGPLLKPGFPMPVWTGSGGYTLGADAVTVGDIDGDQGLEILVSGRAEGKITAVEPDGTPVRGWPNRYTGNAEYLSLVDADRARPGLEVAAMESGDRAVVMDGHGVPLPGWPRINSNFGSHAMAAADLNRDGRDELAFSTEDREYTVRDDDGDVRAGWPRWWPESIGQRMTQPVLADLDGDGSPEVIGGGDDEPTDPTIRNLIAFHGDGRTVAGWPRHVAKFDPLTRIVAGEVDGDPQIEILVPTRDAVHVLRPDGSTERLLPQAAMQHSSPALADLDEDGEQELILGASAIYAFQEDGSRLPGFPVITAGNSPGWEPGPIVGDLDNDGHQDIVVTGEAADGSGTVVAAVSRTGQLLPGFPIKVPVEYGYYPALADIDRNGRTDLIVAGTSLDSQSGWNPGLYVYEYPNGQAAPPAWSQYGGGPRHQFIPGQALYASAGPNPGNGTQTAFTLVRDAVPGGDGVYPRDLVVTGNRVHYSADDPVHGRELWVSDGTSAGTRLVTDLRAGPASSNPDFLTSVGSGVVFVADDGSHGRELFWSDGTAPGTRLVKDLQAGVGGSAPESLTRLGGRVFFSADGGGGRELWVTDGTASGTHLVADPTPVPGQATDPEGLVRAGSRLVFDGADTVTDPDFPRLSWFATDGTDAGTVRLTEPTCCRRYRTVTSGSPYGVVALHDQLAWVDGTPSGTRYSPLGIFLGQDPAFSLLSLRGSRGLLTAQSSQDDPKGFWASPTGFGALSHQTSHGYVPVDAPAHFTPLRTGWIFSAAPRRTGRELWWSDGTPARTHPVTDLVAGGHDANPVPLLTAQGMALIRVTTPGSGDELWRTDGTTAATTFIADLAAGRRGSQVTDAVVLGSRIILVADDGHSGPELWRMPLARLGPLPNTRITARPATKTTRRWTTVRFTSSIPASRFRCRFDGGSSRPCTSPWQRRVSLGRHRLTVQAITPYGLADPTPAIVKWRVTRRR